jgi:hypothetical protein
MARIRECRADAAHGQGRPAGGGHRHRERVAGTARRQRRRRPQRVVQVLQSDRTDQRVAVEVLTVRRDHLQRPAEGGLSLRVFGRTTTAQGGRRRARRLAARRRTNDHEHGHDDGDEAHLVCAAMQSHHSFVPLQLGKRSGRSDAVMPASIREAGWSIFGSGSCSMTCGAYSGMRRLTVRCDRDRPRSVGTYVHVLPSIGVSGSAGVVADVLPPELLLQAASASR